MNIIKREDIQILFRVCCPVCNKEYFLPEEDKFKAKECSLCKTFFQLEQKGLELYENSDT